MFTIPKNWNMFTICYVFLFYFTALGGGYKKDGNRTGSVQRWGVYSASSRTQTFHVIFIWKKVNLFFFSCRSTEWYFETEAGDRPHEHHSDTAKLLRQIYRFSYWKTGSKVGFSIHFIYDMIWKSRAVCYERKLMLIIYRLMVLSIDC